MGPYGSPLSHNNNYNNANINGNSVAASPRLRPRGTVSSPGGLISGGTVGSGGSQHIRYHPDPYAPAAASASQLQTPAPRGAYGPAVPPNTSSNVNDVPATSSRPQSRSPPRSLYAAQQPQQQQQQQQGRAVPATAPAPARPRGATAAAAGGGGQGGGSQGGDSVALASAVAPRPLGQSALFSRLTPSRNNSVAAAAPGALSDHDLAAAAARERAAERERLERERAARDRAERERANEAHLTAVSAESGLTAREEAEAFLRARAEDRAVEDALSARAMLRDRGALGGYTTAEAAVTEYAFTQAQEQHANSVNGAAGASAATNDMGGGARGSVYTIDGDNSVGAGPAAAEKPQYVVREDGTLLARATAPPMSAFTAVSDDPAVLVSTAAAARAKSAADAIARAEAIRLSGAAAAGAGGGPGGAHGPLGTGALAGPAGAGAASAEDSVVDKRSTPFTPMQHLRLAVERPCMSCFLAYFILLVLWFVAVASAWTNGSFVNFLWTDFPLEVTDWNLDGGYFRSQGARAAEEFNNVRLEYVAPVLLMRSSVERELEVIYSAQQGNVFNMDQLIKIFQFEQQRVRDSPTYQDHCLLDWATITNGGFNFYENGDCVIGTF